MSRRASARLAALLSAIALAFGVSAATTATFDSTVLAGPCCTGHV
jgi:hypothetical protein